MVITNKNNRLIQDFKSWETAFLEVDEAKHWKQDKSAYTLAKYFTNPEISNSNGINTLNEYVKACGFNDIEITHAEIEHESRFDRFKGRGRMQDMVVWANTKNKSIAICIEAKVDECFNETIYEEYTKALTILYKNNKSRKKARIENLCEQFFPNKTINDLKTLRYQLLYYLAGSIKEAEKIGGIAFMPIIVFKTKEFNTKKGEANKKDYIEFINLLEFKKEEKDGKTIYFNNFGDTDVYTCYIEI